MNHSFQWNPIQRQTGLTLVEVLVALSMVAIALASGAQAASSLTNTASRQSSAMLAKLCAENELINMRLAQQFPDIGTRSATCEQAGRSLQVELTTQPTPNADFRRVETKVSEGGVPLLWLSTVVARH